MNDLQTYQFLEGNTKGEQPITYSATYVSKPGTDGIGVIRGIERQEETPAATGNVGKKGGRNKRILDF